MGTHPGHLGVGSSSSCFHGSCCTNLLEVARFRRSSCSADLNLSLTAIGHIAWPRVSIALVERLRPVPVVRVAVIRTTWKRGQHVLRLSPRCQQNVSALAVAPGTRATLGALQDLERRLPLLRDPSPPDILNVNPVEQFSLDTAVFTSNIGSARRGAAGGPSGMTAEHLRLVLESVPDTAAFHRAQDLARAEIPPDVVALLRMGRLTALQKPGGGVRGIVCGDLVRRLVARSIAQQISSAVAEATSPFQYALTTKAGKAHTSSSPSQTWTVVPPCSPLTELVRLT